MKDTKLNVILWSILIFLAILAAMGGGADVSDYDRLRATIFRNYDPHSRPVQNHGDLTSVSLYFTFMGFQFDEQKGKLSLYLTTHLNWQDEHASWNPLDYGNLTEITVTPSELWKPDISVVNNYDESEIQHFGETPMWITNDSDVWWGAPTKFQVGCETDFKLWPYDRQTCKIYMSSWVHEGEELDISLGNNNSEFGFWDYDGYNMVTPNREWKLAKHYIQRYSFVYCCPEMEFPTVAITVEIERKSDSHTAAVTVVGLGIAIAILISFWLDPFAHVRIPLTLLIMIVNALYLQFMHRTIPNNGATVPLAVCFFRDSLILVTFALEWVVGMRYLTKLKRNSSMSLPNFVETFLNSFIAKMLCLNPRPQTKSESQKKQADISEEDGGDVSELVGEEEGEDHQEDWEWVARLLDRIAFLIYLITYVIFISAFL